MSEQEFDTDYTNEIVCPYCGYQFTDSWELQGGQDTDIPIECGRCEKSFIFSTDYHITYSSHKCDCLNGKDHQWGKVQHLWEDIYHKRCKDCGKSENVDCNGNLRQ